MIDTEIYENYIDKYVCLVAKAYSDVMCIYDEPKRRELHDEVLGASKRKARYSLQATSRHRIKWDQNKIPYRLEDITDEHLDRLIKWSDAKGMKPTETYYKELTAEKASRSELGRELWDL